MRKVFVRILLVLLVGVAIYSILSRVGSSGAPIGFSSLGVNDLEHSAFRVDAPVRMALDAVGSFEETGGQADSVLAAYGWIVRHSDGKVIWRMRPSRHPDRGSLAAVKDTIALQPGTYDAYFASYGDPLVRQQRPAGDGIWSRFKSTLSRGGRSWHGEADRWHFLGDGVTEADQDAITSVGRDNDDANDDPRHLWSALRISDREQFSTIVRVTATTRLHVSVLGETVSGSTGDGGRIVRMADSDTVWTSGGAPSSWAGGSVRNRRVDDVVSLEPGLYQLEAWADDSHAYSDWVANPPFAPWQWGMTVRKDSADSAVSLFDTADPSLEAIARFDCVGSDEDLREVLTFAERTLVVVTSTGEVTDSQTYDGASLYSGTEPLESNLIWELKKDDSEHAGGNSKNRTALSVIALDPGVYLVRYTSDDVYDCADDYNGGTGPDNGHWGFAMYAADPSFDPSSVTRDTGKLPMDGDDPGSTGTGTAPPRESFGTVLVDLREVGNSRRERATFTLDEESTVRIVALGELLPSERLDYGWIEDEDGDTVWEMTRGNTRPAGGDAKNREFDGTITLVEGTYTVHFETNARHAFGRFEGGEPDSPASWGIVIAFQ